jgi:hypothetical protein
MYLESYELLCHIFKLNPNDDNAEEQLEDLLYENYGIVDLEGLDNLLELLVPYCNVDTSILTGITYCGFADKEKQCWLLRKRV